MPLRAFTAVDLRLRMFTVGRVAAGTRGRRSSTTSTRIRRSRRAAAHHLGGRHWCSPPSRRRPGHPPSTSPQQPPDRHRRAGDDRQLQRGPAHRLPPGPAAVHQQQTHQPEDDAREDRGQSAQDDGAADLHRPRLAPGRGVVGSHPTESGGPNAVDTRTRRWTAASRRGSAWNPSAPCSRMTCGRCLVEGVDGVVDDAPFALHVLARTPDLPMSRRRHRR